MVQGDTEKYLFLGQEIDRVVEHWSVYSLVGLFGYVHVTIDIIAWHLLNANSIATMYSEHLWLCSSENSHGVTYV